MVELKPINQMKIKRTITLLDDDDADDDVCVQAYLVQRTFSDRLAHVHIKSSQPYRPVE